MNQRSDTDRLLRHWMSDGPSTMPDRVLDVVADRISRQPQRRAWRLQGRPFVNTNAKLAAAAAAVLVVGLISWQLLPDIPDSGSGPSPTPLTSATPSTTPAPSRTPAPPATPRVTRMDVQGESIRWTAVIPAGWSGNGWSLTRSQGYAGPTGIGVAASGAVNVPIDPCDGVGKESGGQTVVDVVTALEAREDLVVSDPTATTLGGYSGLRVDVEMPADLSVCGEDLYILFAEPDGSGIYAQGLSAMFSIWIVDVDGQPIVIYIDSYPGTPAGDLAEAQQIVDSIVITP